MRLGLEPGDQAHFARTLTEMDLALCAAITGDFDPIHVNEEFAATTVFGRRIAHGALILGLCSTTASRISQLAIRKGAEGVPVSLGYDRVRFLKPAFVGDTLRVTYTVDTIDEAQARTRSTIAVVNQHGDTVLAGTHVLKFTARQGAPAP